MNKKMAITLILAGSYFLPVAHVSAQTETAQKAADSKSTQAASEEDIQLLRKDLRSLKKQLIEENLSLTSTEATKFWPVYERYEAEYIKIGDAKLALIEEYQNTWGTITDEQALNYLKRAEEIDESALQLRKKYVPLVKQVLPGKKTATFFQLERRIDMLMDVQAASLLPLVQRQGQ